MVWWYVCQKILFWNRDRLPRLLWCLYMIRHYGINDRRNNSNSQKTHQRPSYMRRCWIWKFDSSIYLLSAWACTEAQKEMSKNSSSFSLSKRVSQRSHPRQEGKAEIYLFSRISQAWHLSWEKLNVSQKKCEKYISNSVRSFPASVAIKFYMLKKVL